MIKYIINNGDTGLTSRNKINNNFTSLFDYKKSFAQIKVSDVVLASTSSSSPASINIQEACERIYEGEKILTNPISVLEIQEAGLYKIKIVGTIPKKNGDLSTLGLETLNMELAIVSDSYLLPSPIFNFTIDSTSPVSENINVCTEEIVDILSSSSFGLLCRPKDINSVTGEMTINNLTLIVEEM